MWFRTSSYDLLLLLTVNPKSQSQQCKQRSEKIFVLTYKNKYIKYIWRYLLLLCAMGLQPYWKEIHTDKQTDVFEVGKWRKKNLKGKWEKHFLVCSAAPSLLLVRVSFSNLQYFSYIWNLKHTYAGTYTSISYIN